MASDNFGRAAHNKNCLELYLITVSKREVSGNHQRRVKEGRCDEAEMRRILGDWYDQDLFDMSPADAIDKLIDICDSDSVRLRPLAKELSRYESEMTKACDAKTDSMSMTEETSAPIPPLPNSETDLCSRLADAALADTSFALLSALPMMAEGQAPETIQTADPLSFSVPNPNASPEELSEIPRNGLVSQPALPTVSLS